MSPKFPNPQSMDIGLIDDILKAEEKKKAREQAFYRQPMFWFIAGTAALAPALFLPWIRLFQGAQGTSLGAFKLPFILLLTGHKIGISLFSAGVLSVILLAASLTLSLKKDRIVSYLRLTAWLGIFLTLFTFLFALRAWNLRHDNLDLYAKYECDQILSLGKAFGGGGDAVTICSNSGVIVYPIPPSDEFTTFMTRMIGPGALFPLFSGLIVLVCSYIFAPSQRFLSYQIPANLAAVGIVFGGIFVMILVIALFFPAKWLLLNASIYQSMGKYDRQEQALKKCVALRVPPLQCDMDLGKLYFDTNREDQALVLFQDIAKRYPRYFEVNKYIGIIFFHGADYVASTKFLELFRQQVKSDETVNRALSDSLRRIAEALAAKGRLSESIQYYQKAYGLVPALRKDAGINQRIGQLLINKRNYREAGMYYKRAADNDGTFQTQVDAAAVLEADRDFDGAAKYYQRCIEKKADELECYHRLAIIQSQYQHDPASAIKTIDTGLELVPVGAAADKLKALREKIQ